MNKNRRMRLLALRDELTGLRDKLEELMGEAEELAQEEQEAYDNLPESLQCSGRGERMQEMADGLEEVYTNVSNAKEALAFAEQRKKNGCANVCHIFVRKDDPRL